MTDQENNRLKWLAAALCLAILVALASHTALQIKKRSTPYVVAADVKTKTGNQTSFLPTPEAYLSDLGDLSKLAAIWPKLPYPGPHDWLANFSEKEQTVNALVRSATERAKNRSIGIAIQPILPLDESTEALIPQIARYLEISFQCPVRILTPLKTPREFYFREERQINASRLLDYLVSKRPENVWSTAGITSFDMSTPDLNFVFGLSSLTQGVNVSSAARQEDRDPKVTLGRISCTMAHELAHALGMTHCVAWSCMLNGSNHLAESDARPKLFCPHCVAKLKALRGFDPMKYYSEAEAFFAEQGMEKDRQLSLRSLAALKTD